MSINTTEYKIRLRGFVEALRIVSRNQDTKEAKLTIHSDGLCELNDEILTIEQLAERLDVAFEAYYDDAEAP